MFGGGGDYAGAQFGGGGFMPTQGNDAGYGGGGQHKARGAPQTLRAVTIRQILQNLGQQDADNVRVDGAELQTVTVLGKIVDAHQSGMSYCLVLSDGTGTFDVHYWKNSEESEWEESAKRAQWRPGAYVRVYGAVRCHDQKYQITAYTIRAIIDFNEVTHHFLQCIFQHLHLTKGQSGMGGAGAGGAGLNNHAAGGWNGNQGGGFGGGAAAGYQGGAAGGGGGGGGRGAGGSCQDAVMAVMHESSGVGDGLHINEVVARMNGRFNRAQVSDALTALVAEALVYTTTDDDHFSCA